MDYRSILRQDYDKKMEFRGESLFCYSKKEFKRLSRKRNFTVVGETTGRGKTNCDSWVELSGHQYGLLKPGSKSRLFYREAGYLQLENEGFIVLLQSRLPFLLLLIFAAAVLAPLLWLFLIRLRLPDALAPLPVDANVGEIQGDDSEKKESPEGGGSVTLTYSLDAELSLSTGKIQMYFLNPNASNHDIALELYVLEGEEMYKVAESGRIQPGYGLTQMEYQTDEAVLSQGEYEALYLVSFFDSESGERALVESTVTDVTLVVGP